VWSEKPVGLALADAERDVVDRPELGFLAETVSFAKAFAQVAHLNSWILHDQTSERIAREGPLVNTLRLYWDLEKEPLSQNQARISRVLTRKILFIESPVDVRIIHA